MVLLTDEKELEATNDEDLLFSATIGGFVAQNFEQVLQVVDVISQEFGYIDPKIFWEKLDNFREELFDNNAMKYTAGTIAVTSLAATAGYVFWMIKGGYLLAGMVSSLPAWQFLDPLPIFDNLSGGCWKEEDEDVEDMFE